MDFPETPAPGVSSSDHFRPYLNSKNLRFSFGGIKGRPWENWQHDVAKMDLPSVVQKLEDYGFAAIYINRNGCADKANGILQAFQNMGYRMISNKTGDLVCVFIHPSIRPVLPPERPR